MEAKEVEGRRASTCWCAAPVDFFHELRPVPAPPGAQTQHTSPTAPSNMPCGPFNQACARCPILARLGPSTPQNDRTEWGINLVY